MPITLPVDTLAPPCRFCEVIAGRFEKGVVEETPLTVTMVSGAQFEFGQVFVAPRQHRPTLLDLTPDELGAVLVTSQRIAKALIKAYDPDGILVFQNNGVASGQSVPHYHMQLVPRYTNSTRWVGGPQDLAAVTGGTSKRVDFNPQVSTEREREIAAHIRRFL